MLQDVKEVIKYYNQDGPLVQQGVLFKDKISNLIIDDLDLEPVYQHEF